MTPALFHIRLRFPTTALSNALEAVLHTILFHRTFETIEPCERETVGGIIYVNLFYRHAIMQADQQ